MDQGWSGRLRWAVVALTVLVAVCPALAQAPPIDNPWQIPDLRSVVPPARDAGGVSSTLQIFVILTVLSLAPSIIIMTTSFTRIVVVLALVRQAIGVAQLPPGQVIIGLALFLTGMIMAPTWGRIHQQALVPYLSNEPGMTQARALETAGGILREFMFQQIQAAGNEEDVYLFYEYARGEPVGAGEQVRLAEVPTYALIPAFMLSELKTAFVMGFRVYLPFLVIDMVVATILISMGMLMLPPMLVSLPFKILLFVLADGWSLIVGTLLNSFTRPGL